jgi:hypothetical protein
VGLGDLSIESGVDECSNLCEERVALGVARVAGLGCEHREVAVAVVGGDPGVKRHGGGLEPHGRVGWVSEASIEGRASGKLSHAARVAWDFGPYFEIAVGGRIVSDW